MNTLQRSELLATLSELSELSPAVRFGQLLANIGFLVEARAGQSVWDVEDDELLDVMEQHRAELAQRSQPSAVRLAKRST